MAVSGVSDEGQSAAGSVPVAGRLLMDGAGKQDREGLVDWLFPVFCLYDILQQNTGLLFH